MRSCKRNRNKRRKAKSARPGLSRPKHVVSRGKDALSAQAAAERPQYEGVAAERKISELVNQLRARPDFEIIKDWPVGQFWDKKWPPAPFEEALTLKNVAGLDIENLLKKRSFSGEKVSAFIAALEKALAGEQGGLVEQREAQSWPRNELLDFVPGRGRWKLRRRNLN